jgi:RimJ/RimL family protein N-acetyltransferase
MSEINIKTERLLLLPISSYFANEIYWAFKPEVTKYMFPMPPKDFEETKTYIEKCIAQRKEGTDLVMVILNKNTHEFIGNIGIHDIHTPTPTLGIWTKIASHGNGFGFEAMTGLIKWANNNLKFEYLTYPVDSRNVRSVRIAEKCHGVIKRDFKDIGMAGNELCGHEYWIYPDITNNTEMK